jgi:ABC-type transport system involved in multi-copper enzyme maturation permease subunit
MPSLMLDQSVQTHTPRYRRIALAALSLLTNRQFVFSWAAVVTIAAKCIHIYAHRLAISNDLLSKYGYSFFLQDMVLLVLVYILVCDRIDTPWPCVCLGVNIVTPVVVFLVVLLGIVQITFFATAGSEIHWKNIAVASDPAGRAVLLEGLVTCVFVTLGSVFCGSVLSVPLSFIVGLAADIVCAPFVLASILRSRRIVPAFGGVRYSPLDVESCDSDSDIDTEKDDNHIISVPHPRHWPWVLMVLYAGVAAAVLASFILTLLRPRQTVMTVISWTAVVLPFVEFFNSASALQNLQPCFNSGINQTWDSKSALSTPIALPWLPTDHVPSGFEDWYENRTHYTASHDPLRVSNLDSDLLVQLKNVPIRHVVTILLESTRKDAFPVKRNSISTDLLGATWDGGFPDDVVERLRTLTPTARYLTGDYHDGFEHPEEAQTPRGGFNFDDAYTTSTYTLKSATGILCGVSPLVADFNLEHKHHIYQPCLPQVLDVLPTGGDNFRSYPWKSTFMQSITMNFDDNKSLVDKIGFQKIIDKEYLQSEDAKFGKVDLPDVNYFGMVEEPLLDYIRDEFQTAKENNERVLISHITSTSHHPYHMPASEKYVPLGNGKYDDLSKYINAIGYDDRWLGKVLDLLDELDVANETLVVFVGDHGLSIPENGKLPSYYNPNTIINHVPLVLSHPLIPPISINSSVSSVQILPSILDLLIESGSLSTSGTQAASDLLHNYEGQSLVRPVQPRDNWQFTVVNPGSAQLGVRDALHTTWHLVVPVVDSVEWQFSNDEHDTPGGVVLGFDFKEFVEMVEERHGIEAARWAEEAAFVSRWWVEENTKRWRYWPYND